MRPWKRGNIWRPNTMKHCCTLWSNGINPFWPPSKRTKRFTIFDERLVDLQELSNIIKHHQIRQCPNDKMFGNQMFDRVLSPKISLLDSPLLPSNAVIIPYFVSRRFSRSAQLTERLKEAVRDARVTSLGILCYSVLATTLWSFHDRS